MSQEYLVNYAQKKKKNLISNFISQKKRRIPFKYKKLNIL